MNESCGADLSERAAQKSRALDALYACLPKLNCQRKCQGSCGPIFMSDEERRRVEAASGKPFIFKKFSKIKAIMQLGKGGSALDCSLLKSGGCSVYAVRPIICRLYGLTPKMACPFGCVPERWLSDEEASDILKKAGEIGGNEGVREALYEI